MLIQQSCYVNKREITSDSSLYKAFRINIFAIVHQFLDNNLGLMLQWLVLHFFPNFSLPPFWVEK
jgi:hypothetical protein